jgi:hypothetical protein
MENIPVNTPAPAGWKPTTATVSGAVIGGATAQLAAFVLGYFGITLDAATAAALATVLGTLATYLHPAPGGRK